LDFFTDTTRRWFAGAFERPTDVQRLGWERIAAGDHTLLIAPTGSGKTLAAFLYAIDRLTRLPADAEPGVRVVYISPQKALAYDIDRNLRVPLAGIRSAADPPPDMCLNSAFKPGTGGLSVRYSLINIRYHEIEMHRCPVPLIITLLSRTGRSYRARRFGQQIDWRGSTEQLNDTAAQTASGMQIECTAVEFDGMFQIVDINIDE
jgi:CRISPR/Cas system-associated endonuclease/helicase Cas3